MKTLALSAAFVLASTFAVAQSKTTTTTTKQTATVEKTGHDCSMANAKSWESLKLSPEQQAKMEAISASCEKECSALPKGDAKRTKAMTKYEQDVKGVLTPEQYKNWNSCCAGKGEKHDKKGHDQMKQPEKGSDEPMKEEN